MSIRTRDQLNALFTDEAVRGEESQLTAEKVRDLIDSIGVGGAMYGTDTTQDITTSWATFTAFEGEFSHGMIGDFVTGTWTVPPNGDGFYKVDFIVTLLSPATGKIGLRIQKNGNNTPFKVINLDVVADKTDQYSVKGSGDLVAGDELTIEIVGNGNITIGVLSTQYQTDR